MRWEEKWKKIKPLGEGGQADVYLVRETPTAQPEIAKGKLLSGLETLKTNVWTGDAKVHAGNDLYEGLELAIQASVDPRVGALKLRKQVPTHGKLEQAQERMRREMLILKELDDSHIVGLIDEGEAGEWFVMEFIGEETLKEHQQHSVGDLKAALTTIRPIVASVSRVHQASMVHRDIKPDNIFVSPQRALVLGDFGLVHSDDYLRQTEQWENIGSWQWMPTSWTHYERVEDITAKFDVFAFGKVIWWMISGKDKLTERQYREPRFNLEELFPNNPEMALANRLFDKCVTDKEEQCQLSHAGDLLDEIDEILHALSNQRTFFGSRNKYCSSCGLGTYKQLLSDRSGPQELKNFGIVPADDQLYYYVYVCDYCGHVRKFQSRRGKILPAWLD